MLYELFILREKIELLTSNAFVPILMSSGSFRNAYER